MNKSTRLGLVAAGVLGSASQAFAVTDYSAITSSASFTEATTAIISVFGIMATLYVAVKGGKLIIAAIKGA